MGFEGDRNSEERVFEGAGGLRRIGGEKLRCGEDLADGKVGLDGCENVHDAWYIVGEGDVDGLDVRPEGKATIGDYESVGVPHPAEQRVDGRIENSALEHTDFLLKLMRLSEISIAKRRVSME